VTAPFYVLPGDMSGPQSPFVDGFKLVALRPMNRAGKLARLAILDTHFAGRPTRRRLKLDSVRFSATVHSWCQGRGSNEKAPLKTRELLVLRKARNAESAVSAISWHAYGTRSARDSEVGLKAAKGRSDWLNRQPR
jgi:hypothetical protein